MRWRLDLVQQECPSLYAVLAQLAEQLICNQ